MDFERVWLPWIYLYGAGGVLFAAGLVLVLRTGACDPRRPRDRRWIRILVGGYLGYAALHLALILAALASAAGESGP